MDQVALNVELPAGSAPEWVELIPAGPQVLGRDGREWTFDRIGQKSVLNRFRAHGAPLPLDWEHATEVRANQGQEAPAAGWLTKLEMRGEALWGRVEWTGRAAEQVANREYRFLSPVFFYQKEGRRIMRLCSAGLTNTPNLRLRALNRAGRPTEEDEDMNLKALCKILGLPETASEEQVVQAVTALKADQDKAKNKPQAGALPKAICDALGVDENASADAVKAKLEELAADKAETVDLNRFVPRADLDQALNRAATAEAELKTVREAEREDKITAAVDAAQGEGKIAPASRDFYLAMCRKDGGLEEFEKFAASAPQVINDPELPSRPKEAPGALNETETAVCRNLGIDPEDYAKSIKEG